MRKHDLDQLLNDLVPTGQDMFYRWFAQDAEMLISASANGPMPLFRELVGSGPLGHEATVGTRKIRDDNLIEIVICYLPYSLTFGNMRSTGITTRTFILNWEEYREFLQGALYHSELLGERYGS
jgi:hypothetical protein